MRFISGEEYSLWEYHTLHLREQKGMLPKARAIQIYYSCCALLTYTVSPATIITTAFYFSVLSYTFSVNSLLQCVCVRTSVQPPCKPARVEAALGWHGRRRLRRMGPEHQLHCCHPIREAGKRGAPAVRKQEPNATIAIRFSAPLRPGESVVVNVRGRLRCTHVSFCS